ncbi:Wyosine base formation domain protein [Methanococcus vannielii SB]|uniref:S-adenosyl-L-methionine-dependent tRNA 4-demethylwyosine synthase n=1 Tax=Methanococcus vannielii (strain ATCC 35089 / DSM 1224 / JCM 13029 / OCM 148 / SB) TaxID=406327 RepID=A6UQ85_METVS|nr:4-demethylwyosine synthase TYW1 [Methanococcus vannielii]ABR54657.1 Wyosine base formation domain protein [Methanococcus vannielii SB]
MIPDEIYNVLRKQHYQIKGHSSVKLCGWVRKSFLDGNECYKSKFYGINTHRCIQSTPSVAWCQQECMFCWRILPSDLNTKPYSLPEWKNPENVAEDILKMHRTILMGYKGILNRIGEEKFNEAMTPKHIALSLSGEPTMYPYLAELIEIFHNLGMSTFLVSNGILTEIIEKVNPTQLYISLDAYDLESYKKICNGTEKDWENILNTLDILKNKKRSCIRTTVIRNINDDLLKFKELYSRSNANFIEIKSYMNVGYSRKRLELSDMLKHEELLRMCENLEKNSSFEITNDSFESRVVLLSNKDKKLNPKIDFGF